MIREEFLNIKVEIWANLIPEKDLQNNVAQEKTQGCKIAEKCAKFRKFEPFKWRAKLVIWTCTEIMKKTISIRLISAN